MKDFIELESLFEHAPVRSRNDDLSNGVLHLNRAKSQLRLLSNSFQGLDGDEHGWFDLRLLGPNMGGIYVFNAITTSTSFPGGRGPQDLAFNAHNIFPNMIVFDERGTWLDDKVTTIGFQLNSLKPFFQYRYSEPLSCFNLSEAESSTLRGLRFNDGETSDFFDPIAAYIVHLNETSLQFQVGPRTYRVQFTIEGTLGTPHDAKARAIPCAYIDFSEPIRIHHAVDFAFEWRRFFSQIAMRQLPFTALSLKRSVVDEHWKGSIYLPNEIRTDPASGLRDLSPAYIPLNEWKDREKLALSMSTWLHREPERKLFRARLDKVLESFGEKIDALDLVELSGAIDSLQVFDEGITLPEGSVQEMASAAVKVASRMSLPVSQERIEGLLSNLSKTSLKRKIKSLSDKAMPQLDGSDRDKIVSLVTKLRHATAHQASLRGQVDARVGPAVEALAAFCVAFDLELETLVAKDRLPTYPKQYVEHAIRVLSMLANQNSTEDTS